MLKRIVGGLLGTLLFSGVALAQSCPSAWMYTFTDTTTSSASELMSDLDQIMSCATNTSGGTLTGGTLSGNTTLPGSGQISSSGYLGIGKTPGTPVDVLDSTNGSAAMNITNANAGASAAALIAAQNGSSALYLQKAGTGGTSSLGGTDAGALIDNSATRDLYLYSNANGITLYTAGAQHVRWDANGHEQFSGSAPTPGTGSSDCGTSPSISGNDSVGRITVGSSPGSKCTITFAAAWTNAPICSAYDETAAASMGPQSTSTTSVALIKATSLTASDKIVYQCTGYQ